MAIIPLWLAAILTFGAIGLWMWGEDLQFRPRWACRLVKFFGAILIAFGVGLSPLWWNMITKPATGGHHIRVELLHGSDQVPRSVTVTVYHASGVYIQKGGQRADPYTFHTHPEKLYVSKRLETPLQVGQCYEATVRGWFDVRAAVTIPRHDDNRRPFPRIQSVQPVECPEIQHLRCARHDRLQRMSTLVCPSSF